MMNKVTGILLTVILIGVLISGVMELPEFGAKETPMNNEVIERYIQGSIEETGSFNVVTSIVLDYRGFDTLIEATVLYTAAVVIVTVLMKKTEVRDEESYSQRS